MSKLLVAVGALAVTVSVGSVVPAVSAEAASSSAQQEVAAHRSLVSDRNVIELFTGQGRIIAEHPELAKYVPNGEQHLSAAQISAVLGEYRKAYPRFHEKVTVPLQSGDPYRVLDALHAFEAATERIADSGSVTATGDGKCALLIAVAVAATLWLGVLVWVAGRSGSGLTEEQFAADIAAALPSSRR
jgi:SdpC family antimicrobial peptide